MLLFINQTILPYFIGLIKKGKLYVYYLKSGSENILLSIRNCFKKYKIKFNEISGIIVILNPYSFTNLRITLTISNILSKFLSLSLSGVEVNEFKNIKEAIKIGQKRLRKKIILPSYQKEPNINILNILRITK